LSHGSSSSARPNKQSLSSLWSPAYLRPATNSQQVSRLFLAFLRKEILCVPAYVLTTKEKFHKKDERRGEKERERERERERKREREREKERKRDKMQKIWINLTPHREYHSLDFAECSASLSGHWKQFSKYR